LKEMAGNGLEIMFFIFHGYTRFVPGKKEALCRIGNSEPSALFEAGLTVSGI